MSNKKDLEKVDELLAFTQQAKYFFEKISNIIQRQQEQQNNEPYGVPGSSRAVSSRSSSQAVSSRGSSQAGSQQEPILISSDEDITIKMEKSDTAVTSGISEKDEDKSAVTSATNEKDRGTKKAIRKKNTNDSDKNSRKAISDKAKGKVPVQSSSDDSSSSDSSYSSNSSNTPFYLTKSDMPKDLSDALRKEVIWKYDALPEGKRIDLGQTFTNQQNRVINDIIPKHLKKNRSSSGKKLQEKRKHSNSRRHDKRLKRGRLIKHLQMVKNSLVKKFKDEDLKLIIDNNAYHSPEESETDCENGRSNIIVKDLKWRSDTQHDLMKFAESEKSLNDGYDADVGEEEEETEETILLTSTDQPSNQSSNQPSNQSSDQSSNQQPSGQSSNQPSGQPSGQLFDDDLEIDD
ncbi:hypothetical protein GLOIN_2v1470219 [Rhizophagus clarus]|uniref:Uncharacterized protein n=2 Tax=Rhizophagus clarus TaxID=94130 RepID=A0A8H3M3Q9_9GLOM|nr:hypothetical protein GLOIN_2v1470219 [Rhizophagus clarus]